MPKVENSEETSSPNNYSSWTDSSTDKSMSDFTQIENHKQARNSQEPKLAFEAKIEVFEAPATTSGLHNSFTRSLSLEPKAVKRKKEQKGKNKICLICLCHKK